MNKRKPQKVPKYPNGLRARVQRSHVVHYYYEAPRGLQRKEVALGKDFLKALVKRAKLLLNFEDIDSRRRADFHFISRLYLEACVPTLDPYDQIEVLKSILRLQIYFTKHQLPFCKQTICENKATYLSNRGSNAQIRGGREWTLLWVILRWVSELERMATTPNFRSVSSDSAP